jgi:hypothetical protein
MDWILIVLFWIVPSFIVASIARRRGFSWGAYLAHCLLASPWVAMVTLHVATHGERNSPAHSPA